LSLGGQTPRDATRACNLTAPPFGTGFWPAPGAG